ncbi:MAG: VOC family protein [Pseudomonadota bacterium]
MRAIPHLMFQGDREAAIALWSRAFPDLSQKDVGDGVIEAVIAGQRVSLFDSPQPHDFAFTPSFSFLVDVDTSDDVDRVAGILGDGGTTMMPLDSYDFADRFAWVADRFGVNWQIRYAPT